MVTGLGATVAGAAALAGASFLAQDVLGPKLPKPDTAITALKNPLPPRVRAYGRSKLFGAYALFVTSPTGTAVDVFAILETGGNPIDGVEKLYLGDQVVATAAGTVTGLPDGTYGDLSVSIDFRLGEGTETAFSEVVAALPGVWTDDHRGDGCVTACVLWKSVKAKDYQKVYPNGQPALSMVARWLRVFDWRDENQAVDDPSTWKWSENAVLHTADYILTIEKAERVPGELFPSGPSLQAAWDRFFAPTLESWTAAADDADIPVGLRSGETEPRYRSCVAHKLIDPHKATKARLLACFDGWIAPREDGALVVYSGRYYTPTISIGPDAIVAYSLQEGVEDENAVNDIAVTFVSSDHDFSTVDADNWTDEADIIQRQAIRSDSLQNDVPSAGQARRLAKRKMIQAMAPFRGTITTNREGRDARGERFINLRIEEGGLIFYEGPAEITGLTRSLMTGGVTFSWIAMTPAIDDWNAALEEGNAPPAGGGVAPEVLPAPGIISAVPDYSQVGQTPGGELTDPESVTGARIIISSTNPSGRDDVTWYARWRVGTSGSWNEREYPDADSGPGVEIDTEFVPLAPDINVQVAYSVGDGRFSDYSGSVVVDTTTG